MTELGPNPVIWRVEERSAWAKIISGMVMVAVALLIGLVLVSPLADQAERAAEGYNTTSSTDALARLVPLIFVATILALGVWFLIGGLRGIG